MTKICLVEKVSHETQLLHLCFKCYFLFPGHRWCSNKMHLLTQLLLKQSSNILKQHLLLFSTFPTFSKMIGFEEKKLLIRWQFSTRNLPLGRSGDFFWLWCWIAGWVGGADFTFFPISPFFSSLLFYFS